MLHLHLGWLYLIFLFVSSCCISFLFVMFFLILLRLFCLLTLLLIGNSSFFSQNTLNNIWRKPQLFLTPKLSQKPKFKVRLFVNYTNPTTIWCHNQQPNFFCRILSNLTICAFNLTVWGPSFDRQLCLSWNPLALFS